MNLEKFIETQREMAMELLDFGSSREKAEGIGMLNVLKELERGAYSKVKQPISKGIVYRTIVLPNDVRAGDVVQIKFDTEGVVYDLFDSSMEECKEEFGYDLYEEIEALS